MQTLSGKEKKTNAFVEYTTISSRLLARGFMGLYDVLQCTPLLGYWPATLSCLPAVSGPQNDDKWFKYSIVLVSLIFYNLITLSAFCTVYILSLALVMCPMPCHELEVAFLT